MAAGGQKDDLDSSLDLFDCQVCLEPMVERQPRTLSACNHTFCQLCLDKLVDTTDDRQMEHIICPTCRKVTDVTNGDVTQLPRNFTLVKMKEWQESFMQRERNVVMCKEVINIHMCEVCDHDDLRKEASCKCNDCDVYLCDGCRGKHLSIPACAGHHIVTFIAKHNTQPKCTLHAKVVSFLCFKCNKELCFVCSLSNDHEKHKHKIMGLDEGLLEAKKSLQLEIKQMIDTVDEIGECIEKSEDDYMYIEEVLRDLESKENEIKGKREKIITEYKDPTRKGIEELKQFKEVLIKRLMYLGDESDELNLFLDQGKRRDEMEKMKDSIHVVYKNLQSVTKINTKTAEILVPVKHRNVHCLPNFSSAKFILQVRESITTIKSPYDILQLKNNTAFVGDFEVGYVQQIDTNGHLVGRLYPFGICKGIEALTLFGDNAYIANENGITQVPMDLREMGRYKCAHISNITSLAAIDERRLLLSTHDGKLFEFNVDTQTKKELVRDLGRVFNMSVKVAENGYTFILSQTNTPNGSIVIGKQQPDAYKIVMTNLKSPRACCLTENDTILVAEQGDDRVFEMTLDGRFIQDVLTRTRHRIRSPCGLSLRYPYLWMTEVYEDGKGAIKLFKFQ